MTALTFIAAAETSGNVSATEWLIAIGAFLAVVVAGFVLVVVIQRRLDPRKQSGQDSGGELTTEAVEMMRLKGTISDAEYKVMRQIVIGKTMSRTKPSHDDDDGQAEPAKG